MITNKQGLPEALVRAVTRSHHRSADYSASGLMKPVQMHWLERRHEVDEDVSDMIWQLFGSAVHAIIEQAEHHDQLVEEYLTMAVGDKVLSGKADIYDDGEIQDWKTTSVWSLIFMDERKLLEYESQLNVYAELYRQAGFPVSSLKIVMLFRDWQASKAKYDQNYPQSQVYVMPIKLWSHERVMLHINTRVGLYERYRNYPDGELPECTPEERWAKPGKWAVMKEGRKSAVKLHDSKESAETHLLDLDGKHYLEERPGKQWKRCEYCKVRDVCKQYQEGHDES